MANSPRRVPVAARTHSPWQDGQPYESTYGPFVRTCQRASILRTLRRGPHESSTRPQRPTARHPRIIEGCGVTLRAQCVDPLITPHWHLWSWLQSLSWTSLDCTLCSCSQLFPWCVHDGWMVKFTTRLKVGEIRGSTLRSFSNRRPWWPSRRDGVSP